MRIELHTREQDWVWTSPLRRGQNVADRLFA